MQFYDFALPLAGAAPTIPRGGPVTPLIAALSINPGIGAMCQEPVLHWLWVYVPSVSSKNGARA
jgi:hypothetical protein